MQLVYRGIKYTKGNKWLVTINNYQLLLISWKLQVNKLALNNYRVLLIVNVTQLDLSYETIHSQIK